MAARKRIGDKGHPGKRKRPGEPVGVCQHVEVGVLGTRRVRLERGHFAPGAELAAAKQNSSLPPPGGLPESAVTAFRNSLPRKARTAFNSLVERGCSPERLTDYVCSVRWAFEHHKVSLQKDPDRIRWNKLRSLVSRTRHVAEDWQRLFGSYFGQETLAFACNSDPSGSRVEFENIPQRLRLLARLAQAIHQKTSHLRRPLYDDALAELVVYVELATKSPHNNKDIAALVDFARGADDYSDADLAVWKTEHKEDLERARLRLSKTH